jgi:predicted dehydrogenase
VIHVLMPPASHKALALEALDMGCHGFVEKPMAQKRGRTAMIARAKERGRVLSVNHSARFDPVVLEAAELVRQGARGEVMAVRLFGARIIRLMPAVRCLLHIARGRIRIAI